MVSDYESWSVKISQWLKNVVETNIPVLVICYGHQILAYNDNDSTQSFSYKNHIWVIQFHPEFLANITKEYMKFDKEEIVNKSKNY